MQITNSNMKTQHQDNNGKSMKRILIALNCLLLGLGDTGGPLTSPLYFHHGGRRNWLSSFLETAGFPILLLPLCINHFCRRRHGHSTPILFITPRLFLACIELGLLTGVDDFFVCIRAIFLAGIHCCHIALDASFLHCFLCFSHCQTTVHRFSINSIALLTTGAVLLGLHGSSERPEGVTDKQYYLGFFLIIATGALYGLVLPLIQLTYKKSGRDITTYTLVMEMQFVMAATATAFCAVGMAINKDFQAIPKEAKNFGLGEVRYYMVLTWCAKPAIFWQFFFLGSVGVIFCVNTLLAAIIVAVFIPIIEILAVIFPNEKFSSKRGVALALALWGPCLLPVWRT